MTVHTQGTLTLTAADFKTVHQGVEIGVKIIDWGGSGVPVIELVEKKGALYESTNILFEFDDTITPEKVTATAGGTVAWIKTILLPAINTALAARFKRTGTPPPPVAGGSLADIDKQIGLVLKWAPQADGTLRVVAR